ncbi:MAG: GNAT family N-acetyltransferase [Granulosicoccus sp.]
MQPSLKTDNLVLRPIEQRDALRIQLLAGAAQIAEVTENIPHPYEDGMAESWIETLTPGWENRDCATFAICLSGCTDLLGCCGLQLLMKHKRASLGYWIGLDYWSNGHCTEAASAVIKFGFEHLALHRIEATHLSKNPASGAVMRKIGMSHEATMVDYVINNGRFENMELYSILA